MNDLIYKCNNLNFWYTLENSKIKALKDVNLDIRENDFLCIKGPSGSGKSTLLSLLGLIEPLQDGEIIFNGNCFSKITAKEKNKIRKHDLGFVFQTFNLIPVLTVYENIEYFLTRMGVSYKERKERILRTIDNVGLMDHKDKKPGKLSGGQRQRVAIARALVKSPKVIVADEPTASLDQKTGKEIIDLLKSANTTVILASHDPMVIKASKRVITLQDGKHVG